MVAGNAADIDGVGEVAQYAALTAATAATSGATLAGLFLGSGLLRAFQLAVDVEAHLLAVPRGNDVVPVANPVGRQVDVECMLHAGVQVELQLVVTPLNDAELRVALRHVGRTLVHAAEIARLHVEADGQSLARELHVIGTVHFYPLVVTAEAERALHDLGITHQMGGRVVGRAVLQRTYMFGNSGAHEVPEGAAHQSRMTTDDGPELVHAAAGITGNGQVLVHERRARVLRLGHHRRVHLQLVGRRVARPDDLLAGVCVGIAAIHEVACGVESLTLLHHLGNQRTFATLVTCTPEEYAGVVAVAQHQLLYAL